MILLASIIETFRAEFLSQYHDRTLPGHLQALDAMQYCRTSHSPVMLVRCEPCDYQTFVPHSCGHRICPHCQHHESQQWLERQLQKQVPADYYLLTFTLPAEFRPLAWQHQRTVYSILTQCSWDTVKTFVRNDAKLDGDAGAITVLHTHTRCLDYHPHVHLVMPAAAINSEQRLWRTKKGKRFLFNQKALAKVFRAKMLEALRQADLGSPLNYPKKWIVDTKFVGNGKKALLYLGRYLYRGVLQEKDIIACQDGEVTFRYRHAKSKTMRTRTLPGTQFLWLLLQHVLPKGFRRARNFGFLHPNSKRRIALLQLLLGFDPKAALEQLTKRPAFLCPHCGIPMNVVTVRIPAAFPFEVPQPAG